MSFWTWGAIAVLSGFVVYLGAGAVLGPMLRPAWRRRIADHYFQMSAWALERGLLVRRKHGGYDLVPTSYDAGKEAEQCTLSGEEKNFKDPYGFMRRFYKVPLGVASEAHNAILDPRVAEIGELESDRYARNDHTKLINRGDGQGVLAYAKHLGVPKAMRFVDPATWTAVMPGGADPKDAKTVEEWTIKSQEGYDTRQVFKTMIVLMAYGVGLGGVWFLVKYGGVGGGLGGVNLPIGMMGVFV